ncbi:hypothetical protein AB0383_47835 [Amycolatopsis sp. NPDC051373]|uniref:alpha/beta fold hydrolase n=1 Tax=Amycolatopsis sp. NPDC051373 TaxID=3155801 RepID=UPI00344F6ECD
MTPVPLAGTRLPDADIAPFRALGGQRGPQRAARTQLSVSNSPETLDLLVESGVRIPPPVVAALADAWNKGDPAGEAPSNYRGPVLVVRGAGDGFVTDEMVRSGVIPRFAEPRTALVEQAGHWPHAEQPASLAAAVLSFVAQVTAAASRI